MSLSLEQQDDLQRRIDDLLEGDLEDAARDALFDQLRRDPEAVTFYAQHVALHAELRWEHAPMEPAVAQKPTWRIGRWGALAALLALSLSLGILMQPVASALDSVGVARVAWTQDAQWSTDHHTLPLGAWIKPGPVTVQSGRLALAFDSGAEVILEGPAQFELTGPNGGRLEHGAISSHVPPAAVGFRIDTPQSNIIDRGTDFSVRVDRKGQTEVHVIDGLVDVRSDSDRGFVPVRTQQAVRVGLDRTTQSVGFTREHYQSPAALDLTSPARAAHWAFEPPAPNVDHAGTMAGGPFSLRFEKRHTEFLPGPFGQAVHLDGKNDVGVSDFPGIGGHAPRTTAFWLRVPRDTQGDDAYAILAWGQAQETGRKWQIAWNRHPENGTVGALRTEFSKGYAIGSTDLRDDQWHHIVSVWMGGDNADVATHMRLYVDGRLETLSGTLRERVRTSIEGKNVHTVKMGVNINSWNNPQYFRGDLDEIWVFDRALLPREIHALMATNVPPPTH